jgi:hypothetical protein
LDLTALQGWTAAGQAAIAEAARQLAVYGRPLTLAAIPADGSLVPDETWPALTVYRDLDTALTAHAHAHTHHAMASAPAVRQQWRTADWATGRR